MTQRAITPAILRRAAGAFSAMLVIVLGACASDTDRRADDAKTRDPAYVLDHRATRLDGASEDLSTYEGRVVLVVNTASRCGLTPQYEGLQALYETRRDEGLVVLAFPSNDFRDQEPLNNAEIAEFCERNYGVDFPMFAKVVVNGEGASSLYRDLTSQPEPIGGPIRWNFDKFVVDRHGRVVARFSPRTAPDDPALLATLDRLLAEGPPMGGE